MNSNVEKKNFQYNHVSIDILIDEIKENGTLILKPKKLKYLFLSLPAIIGSIFISIMINLCGFSFAWVVPLIFLVVIIIGKFILDSHSLMLTSKGFNLKGRFGLTSYKWKDIEDIKVQWTYFFKTIVFKYSLPSNNGLTIKKTIHTSSFGLYLILDLYAIKAEDLVSLMKELQQHAIF